MTGITDTNRRFIKIIVTLRFSKNSLLLLALVKKAKNIALYLALGISLLHSIVPHVHHTLEKNTDHCVLKAPEHNHHHNVLGWLGDFFHLSHGEDLPENLRKADRNVPAPLLEMAILPTSLLKLFFTKPSSSQLLTLKVVPLYRVFYGATLGLRGPPSLV